MTGREPMFTSMASSGTVKDGISTGSIGPVGLAEGEASCATIARPAPRVTAPAPSVPARTRRERVRLSMKLNTPLSRPGVVVHGGGGVEVERIGSLNGAPVGSGEGAA